MDKKVQNKERLLARFLPYAVVGPALAAHLTKRNHHPQHALYVWIAIVYALLVIAFAVFLKLKWRKEDENSVDREGTK